MSVQLVIFDCDGVLFHSEAANIGFYNAVFEAAGEAQLGDAGEAACHALASAQLFEKYFGDRPERLARVRAAAQAIEYAPFYPLMKPRERLFEVLENLGKKYKIALATNRGKTVREVLEFFELTSYFDLAVGVYDVARPKPHPDMLIKCLQHFGVAANKAVYVGDQQSDRESADAAGVPFVAIGDAVVDPTHHIDELYELDPILAAW